MTEKVKILFSQLTTDPINLSLSNDRESFFRKIHAIRLSSSLKELHDDIKSLEYPHFDSINVNNFLQVLVLEFTNSFLESLCQTMKTRSEVEIQENVSENDQKILFYIGGYIVHALKKRYSKLSSTETKERKKLELRNLSSKTSNSKYIDKFSTWFEKKDRGGLKRPCDNFFLLLRSVELVIRKHIINNLNMTANSLEKCVLKEKILEDFMVKYYREKLFEAPDDEDNDDDTLSAVVFEDAINLFITIRGFAVMRVQRNKLLKEHEIKKSGESFRQALKTKQALRTKQQ